MCIIHERFGCRYIVIEETLHPIGDMLDKIKALLEKVNLYHRWSSVVQRTVVKSKVNNQLRIAKDIIY